MGIPHRFMVQISWKNFPLFIDEVSHSILTSMLYWRKNSTGIRPESAVFISSLKLVSSWTIFNNETWKSNHGPKFLPAIFDYLSTIFRLYFDIEFKLQNKFDSNSTSISNRKLFDGWHVFKNEISMTILGGNKTVIILWSQWLDFDQKSTSTSNGRILFSMDERPEIGFISTSILSQNWVY